MNEDKEFQGLSLLALFRSEAEGQVQTLTNGLLALDSNAHDLKSIEPLMRAAHSLKGAARVVGLEPVERVSHAMEDCFVAAQKGKLQLTTERIDRLLAGVDLVSEIATLGEQEAPAWLEANKLRIANLLVGVYEAADPERFTVPAPSLKPDPATDTHPAPAPAPAQAPSAIPAQAAEPAPDAAAQRDERVLKVGARNFDRLLSLASETRVTAHALRPSLQGMQNFRKQQQETLAAAERLQELLAASNADATLKEAMSGFRQRMDRLKHTLAERLTELDTYERRLLGTAQEMLDEVLALRMRPFRDGVQGLPRMMRDLARDLGKDVRFDIAGQDTLVDRDVLTRMESPMTQLLRNALDHGMETAQQRIAAGKPAQGQVRLEARHSAGMLTLEVRDDGRGIDPEQIRRTVVERKMASEAMAEAMSAAELLDFLFLPAFSLRESANMVSGRGVGLDVVHATVRQLHGTVRLESEPGQGSVVTITLPLSQSIVRVLVAEVAGEAYAIPLARIVRVVHVPTSEIATLEGRQFFSLGQDHIGLISAAQLLELGEMRSPGDALPVIVIGSGQQRQGLAVDAIKGEQSLAVRPIDGMFGKMRDISAAGLLDDGSPVLILDVADLMVSIDKLAGAGGLRQVQALAHGAAHALKRILVVDDSLTVREMERALLLTRGYEVDVAVDGMDGWNAVRSHAYHLVITDVDMPRMDGIELVGLIKKDTRLRTIPVMIVSYKDRPEDRTRGIDAGANYYLTKGSFHDATLLEAVFDLIGGSGA